MERDVIAVAFAVVLTVWVVLGIIYYLRDCRKIEPEMAVSKLPPPPECRPCKREAGKEKMTGMPKVLYDVEKMTVRDLLAEYNRVTNRMYEILDTCEKENRERTKEEELEYHVLRSYKDDIYRRAMEL